VDLDGVVAERADRGSRCSRESTSGSTGSRSPGIMSGFVEQVHGIYDGTSPCIFPYIGSAFDTPQDGDLRIVAVGINARLEDTHLGSQTPGLYAEWFEKRSSRFQRGVWRPAARR